MSDMTRRTEWTALSRFVLATLLSSLMSFGLAGCATAPKTYEIHGEAGSIVNRDSGGKSLSVAVRIYQLKEATEFSKLTFDTVASGRPESELLGDELLSQSEIIMIPSGKQSNKEALLDGAKYLGIVGLFRQPDRHYWRFLVEADKIRSDGLAFKIQDCYLVLLSPKPAAIPGQPAGSPPSCTEVSQPMAANPARLVPSPANAARNSTNSRTSASEFARTVLDKARKQ